MPTRRMRQLTMRCQFVVQFSSVLLSAALSPLRTAVHWRRKRKLDNVYPRMRMQKQGQSPMPQGAGIQTSKERETEQYANYELRKL